MPVPPTMPVAEKQSSPAGHARRRTARSGKSSETAGKKIGAAGNESTTSRRATTIRWWRTIAAASLCSAGFRRTGLVRGRPIRGNCKAARGSASRPKARPAAAGRRCLRQQTPARGAVRRRQRAARTQSAADVLQRHLDWEVNAGASRPQRAVRADDTPTGWCSTSARVSYCSMVAPRRIATRR